MRWAVMLSSFSLELVIAELMFCLFLKKRPHFWIRLAPTVVIFIALTYDLPFYSFAGWPSFRFVLTFALSVLIMLLCFNASFATVLFCSIAGYAVRSLCQNTYLLLRYIFPTVVDDALDPANYLLFAILYIVSYFVFAKRLEKRETNHLDTQNVKIILISGVVIILNEFLGIWKWVYVLPDNPICPLYGMLSCILALLIQFQLFRESELSTQNRIMEQLLIKEREKYALSKQNVEILNMRAHDIKHNVFLLRRDGTGENVELYCDQLEQAASDYDDLPHTGSIALDTVLGERQRAFNEGGVEFTYLADGGILCALEETDIYSLFGNILANALERERKEPINKRFVSLIVTQKANQIYIHADNYCSDKVSFSDGLPNTTQIGELHGYGSKSIRYIVEKYGGIASFSCHDSRFSVDILIPAGGDKA